MVTLHSNTVERVDNIELPRSPIASLKIRHNYERLASVWKESSFCDR